jgi:Tol biopolymer transport system component
MRGGAASLWRISVSGGTPRPVVGVGRNAFSPSISRKGNQLVYQELEYKNNILRLNLKDEKNRQGSATVVVSAKGPSLGRPHFSPDGKKIAFESDRFGFPEIWICDSDGSNCGQVTSLHGTAGAVNWSPDSRYIAFEFRPKEHSEVYLLEVGVGLPRLLVTLPGADNGGPSWSQDGKWLYFYSDRGGSFQLWKTKPDGGGAPVQVTRNGGAVAMESADRRFLYYAKLDIPGIWRMPLQGGEETRILDQPYIPFAWWNWALGRNGIYFIDKTKPNATIEFLEFTTRKIVPIWTLATPPFVGLSISADGKSILFAQNESRRSDIVLVKNFR